MKSRTEESCIAAPPPELRGAAAWCGPEMAARDDWIVTLSEAEVAELEASAVAAAGADLAQLDPVELPLLTPRLRAILEEVMEGRGFALLRGLPVERWSMKEAAAAFLLLGRHLGRPRSQNADGHLLGHVRDQGRSSSDASVRIYQTRERQTFHTDSCDLVALLCLKTARSGGRSALVSAVTLYNEMRRRRPDLVDLLFRPVATDRRGEIPEAAAPYFSIPVFCWHQGRLFVQYQRQYIESAQRFPEAPRLTPELREALDLFDALADDPALHFTMELRPGDVQLVWNHSLLHDRTAFEDWPEPERRRHLLRLWLAPDRGPPLPPVYAERYGSLEPGRRGGIEVPGTRFQVPL